MTWEEIQRRIARGGLTAEAIGEHWDALFLDRQRIKAVLAFVREAAAFAFIYPMFVFVAETGARRSEMIRTQVEDIDFEGRQVCLREKKRDRRVKLTFRHVPMSPLLAEVMGTWLRDGHPGGRHLFCQQLHTRMKRREELEPLTRNEARHHFTQTLAGSRWEVVRGFHVFRHSFASNLAARGVDQRYIDEWMGHQTEDMRKRYRHLFPKKKEQVFLDAFGD
jgi:integrase